VGCTLRLPALTEPAGFGCQFREPATSPQRASARAQTALLTPLVNHPVVTELEDVGEDHFEQTLDKLAEQVGKERVYSRLWC
jgi:hypothetical protein